jgi:hypothetical protein
VSNIRYIKMFKSPYSTSNGSMHKVATMTKAVELALLSGSLTSSSDPTINGLYYIVSSPETKELPAVLMPLTAEASHGVNQSFTVVDLRPYSSYLRSTKIPTTGPVGLLIKQAILQMIWTKGESERLMSASDLPLTVYATWIANALQTKLGLNAESHAVVKVLAGWFYLCLFLTKDDLGDLSSMTHAKIMKLNRALRADINVVYETVKSVGFLADLSDLVEAIKNVGDPRAKSLNVGLLYTLLQRGWYGHTNDHFMVSAALEFPPYFMGYVYAACTETSMKETPIAKTTLFFKSNNALEAYKITMDGFFSSMATGGY